MNSQNMISVRPIITKYKIHSPPRPHRMGSLPQRKDTKIFPSPLNSYFQSNHLGRRYTSYFWFRSVVHFLWDIRHNAWIDYYHIIHSPDTTIHKTTTAKSTLLNLVETYIVDTTILPKHDILFFACKESKYRSWIIAELQK